MEKYNYLIGIDCGTATGLAVWDGKALQRMETYQLHRALDFVREWKEESHGPVDFAVFVEDARQRKWIPREANMKERIGRAQGAGGVKRDAVIWQEFCTWHGIPLILVPPRLNATKLDPEPFARITGWKKRTSNHARDAAMLVWNKPMSCALFEPYLFKPKKK